MLARIPSGRTVVLDVVITPMVRRPMVDGMEVSSRSDGDLHPATRALLAVHLDRLGVHACISARRCPVSRASHITDKETAMEPDVEVAERLQFTNLSLIRLESIIGDLTKRARVVNEDAISHLLQRGVLAPVAAAGCCKPDGGTCCPNKRLDLAELPVRPDVAGEPQPSR
jgi:hypothetical protein